MIFFSLLGRGDSCVLGFVYEKRIHLDNDYALYGELFKRKGDRSKAQENLGRATEILKECGADGWIQKYQKELAAVQ